MPSAGPPKAWERGVHGKDHHPPPHSISSRKEV